MKNLLKKFIKGYLVLIAFMLFVTIASFVFQSCTNENYYENDNSIDRTAELNNFKESMQIAAKESKYKASTAKSLDLQDVKSRDELALDFVQKIEGDALELIKSYGITERQLVVEFGSLDSEKIALTAQLILAEEDLIDKGKTLSIFVNDDYQLASLSIFGINSTYAQSDTIGGCIADAMGITAAFHIIENGIAGLGTQGVLKIIKKIGGKYLGAIGVALAVYDFADCMGWLMQVGGTLPADVSTYNDLVMVDRASTSAFQATYYISKKDINYKSINDFVIKRDQSYRTFDVEYGDINNPIYKVTFGSETVLGRHLNPLTVREIPNYNITID